MITLERNDNGQSANVFSKPSRDVLSQNIFMKGNVPTITDAATPVSYNGQLYYWDHEYFDKIYGTSRKCTVEINSTNDAYLKQVVFLNGSKPKEIVFGCGKFDFCHDVECESLPLDVLKCSAVVLLLGAVLAYTFYRVKKKQITTTDEFENNLSVPGRKPTVVSSIAPSDFSTPRRKSTVVSFISSSEMELEKRKSIEMTARTPARLPPLTKRPHSAPKL
ncbi:hypothetical protein Y032_0015g2606 [Ancylostoma ceylanicum]|nr:hypothetical protein Y032_0015g2606 [Ancylostoma ceylanicum]